MSTLFVKFPPANETGAIAYCNECNARYAELVSEENGIWYIPHEDVNGNWTIALFGPPWEWVLGVPVSEPASCAALRVDGVVVEHPEWPIEEE